jgi:protocatechuate 3,4-dioxygenase beta subunit
LLILALTISTVQTQVTAGSIAGTVVDRSGRPIPGATVVASDSVRPSTRTAVSDEEGRYRFTDLAPAH